MHGHTDARVHAHARTPTVPQYSEGHLQVKHLTNNYVSAPGD